ncbi:MAG: HelD family protein, partial [Actinomycetota bacterium]
MPHPDLAHEQAHIDRAYACLDAMRVETARLLAAGELGTTEVDSSILKHELEMRYASLGDGQGPLCFGRIDEEQGTVHYIGRRHIKDESDRPVVVDWRAPVAAPFYRATIRDALGLHLRRRFILEDRTLQEIFEEDFDDPDSVAAGHGGVPDPLLAELGRARTGEMRDIVATIQSEQDEIIRWSGDDLVIVQGGPGTGKTAVGLHRAAFLLYERRIELERDGVLVVGPNPTFLEYISGVLPSLGETSVRQATVEGIFGARHRVSGVDDGAVARLKGDERLAQVVRRACLDKIVRPETDLVFDVSNRPLRIARDDAVEAIEKSLGAARDLKTGRELFTDRLQRSAYRHFAERHDPSIDEADFLKELRSSRSFKAERDRLWPSINPTQVVRGVLAGREVLAGAADGILTAAEIEVLARARPRRSGRGPWARGDLPLIDEAETMVSGPSFVYGHVIVDEAQDLSPMELRMIGRRSTGGAMTVLGDLA